MVMKLRYKSQDFQSDATNAICNAFIGQPKQRAQSYILDPGQSNDNTDEPFSPSLTITDVGFQCACSSPINDTVYVLTHFAYIFMFKFTKSATITYKLLQIIK